jgi:hypothetical protein
VVICVLSARLQEQAAAEGFQKNRLLLYNRCDCGVHYVCENRQHLACIASKQAAPPDPCMQGWACNVHAS